MTLTLVFLGILVVVMFGLYSAERMKVKHAEDLINKLNKDISEARKASQTAKDNYESEISRTRNEAKQAVIRAQSLVEQQRAVLEQESLRERKHYEAEAQRIQDEANTELSKAMFELTELKKYASLRDAEVETQRILNDAINEANALRQEARAYFEKARVTADEERANAIKKAKSLDEQAEARVIQATKDAGTIVADAEIRAKQIGADAYEALRDKQTLENAVKAIKNIVEGYGDKYVIPTRSMLDELAADYGHIAAGEALRAAREQSKRMAEQGQAANCDYVETNRRDTAIRFVVDAFNGRVDAILSRVKYDNAGTLEQEIRDAYSLVNMNGSAFRNARILLAYLDVRLSELKWAAICQEYREKEREEQQSIRERIRDEEKARREIEREMREAAKDEDTLSKALEIAQQQTLLAVAEQKAISQENERRLRQQIAELQEKKRELSMAQQTKVGRIYIISNIGSFGENIFKIGMTRRRAYEDRIRELGDASVPFGFDVHATIKADDAPALESQLHKHFVERQVNKVNFRKEFFRIDLKTLREQIEAFGIETDWTMTAKAAEYRESLMIEKAISKDPAKRESWIKRQLDLDLSDGNVEEVDLQDNS